MADLKVCRICLRKGGKVYNYDSYSLKQYYEGIMGKKISDTDSLPKYFCYQCAAFLYKYHKFKEKCLEGEKSLVHLLWSGTGVITLSSISQIDRQEKNLKSTIGLISGRKRVRTVIVTRKTQSENLRQLKKDEMKETEDSEVDYESKGITLSKNLIENLKKEEIIEIDDSEVDNENKRKTLSKNIKEDFKKDEILEIEVSEVDESDNSMEDKNLAVVKNKMVKEKPNLKENEQTNIVDEINTEERAISELEDDRMFSDDEDSWLAAYKIDNRNIVKPITNAEQATLNTEQAKNNEKIVPNEKPKEKKRRRRRKKFEVDDSDPNYLDPKHWLKINLTEEEALEEFRKKALDRKYELANYKCTDCYRGFSQEEMLDRHRRARHSETIGPQECRFCRQRFKLKNLIVSHLEEHFKKYKCLRCDLVCSLKTSAVFHNDLHNGVTRKCIHCQKEFSHLSSYYTHLRSHRSEHVCTLCGASFVSAAGLSSHTKRMHENTVLNPEEAVSTYCKECDIKFETRKAFDKHVIHSSKHVVGVEDLAFGTPAPSLPKKLRKGVHAERKPHFTSTCDICNKTFSTKSAYKNHHLAEHKDVPLPEHVEEPPRQVCEICGISLKPASMAPHLNTHTLEKMFTCATCGMQFNTKASMTRHQLKHTGEKPYPCTMCEKRFTQKCSMMLHFRTFHLKEPYPKRNRKRKVDDQQEKEEYRMNKEDSDEYW